MTTLDQALALASRGFHVFPCEANGKLPAIKDYPTRATRDEKQLRKWFSKPRNIGISTSKFGDGHALVVVDVDCKKGKRGDETLLELELSGCDFPSTLEQATPSGGRHLVYVSEAACKQGTDVLGTGLDIRSRGGYILGPGSEIDGKSYQQINGHGTMAPCPAWLVDRLGLDRRDRNSSRDPVAGVDPDRAMERAVEYLKTAPLAIEGEAGDQTTFKVAARLKDLGCTEDQTLFLLDFHWNPRCSPPWDGDDLAAKVAHAFKYGREAPGSSAPEAIFEPATEPEQAEDAPKGKHPFEKLNESYALIKKGCFVLQETTDAEGRYTTEHLEIRAFHTWHANQPWGSGKKPVPISQAWLESPVRRQYDGVVFMPEQDAGPRWFNLWRGFRVQPAAEPTHPAVKMFMEHALKNVCGGSKELFHWLMGYFAHMIQKPNEKPLVALVFKGRKGTGKNALLDRVGYLLGDHYMVADDDRYLLGNFNAHLETNLFFVLDEAAWAGDKKAEGRLKGLITGGYHNIERKGREMYRIKNLTRVAIIGNEEWLVPASQDERRFAVFNLGDGRLQDRQFFIEMREGMEQGGAAHLLRYLLDFDLSTVDVNAAPNNQALVDQKIASLPPLQQWWFDCVHGGQISGGDWGGEWPASIPTNRLREAYFRWSKTRNIHGRLEEEVGFGKAIKHLAPSMVRKRARPDDAKDNTYAYLNPGIERLRSDWERFIGGPIEWPE